MKLITHLPAFALALIFGASLHAANSTPSAVEAQLDAQPTLRANTENISVTVVGQNLTVYGGAFFHRNFTDTSAYPTPQYVAALLDSSGAVVAQFALAADGSHRAGLGAVNPAADDGQTVSQITSEGDVETFVWTLPLASGSYTLTSTSLELPDSNNITLAAQTEGVAVAPTAMSAPASGGKMMTASVITTGQPPQSPSVWTQTGITITTGGSFVFNGTATFFTFQVGSNPPSGVAYSPFEADLYNSTGGLVASYTADANGGFASTLGTTGGSTFTPNSGGGGSALQWTIPSGLAAGSYTLKVTTGQNMAVDGYSGSSTTCVTAGGGNGAGVNASGLTINYSTTTPGASISATPASLMKGLTVTVKPSYYSASGAVLTGSTGSGVGTITNPSTSVQATTSVVGNVTYTLTAYGTADLSWVHLQGFDKIYLNGGSYSNTDVSSAFSVSNVALGSTYYLVYKQSATGVSLTSNSVTPTTSGAKSKSVTTIPPVASTPSNATIKAPPSSTSATVGNNATFTGRTEGYPAPTVQWQISTNGGSSWSNLNSGGPYVITSAFGSDTTKGWTDTTLKVQNATLAMNGYKFQFVGTDADGSATSIPAATLTVEVAPPPGSDIPAMPPLALGTMAVALMAAGYKFLPKKRHD